MNGLLLIDKPAGPTSHDAVDVVRAWAGTRRVGHLGTLDPPAEGLLLMCLGDALKAVPWLEGFDKEYLGRVRFGVTTDTQDTTGDVLDWCDTGSLTPAAVQAAFAGVQGEIQQVPPMVSALKVDGRKLVNLARAGEVVERQPRPVTVYDLQLLRLNLPEVEFCVRVSKGTYVRTLCHDVGERLGCGASLAWLRRTRIGPFAVEQAVKLDALSETPKTALLPLLAGLTHLTRVDLTAEEKEDIKYGRKLPREVGPEGTGLTLIGPDGALVAIGIQKGGIRPVRVLDAY